MYANFAYYCLHKLHKLPHEIFSLDENEQAFVFAAVSMKAKADKDAADKAKRNKPRQGRR